MKELKYNRISKYKIEKLMWYFCVDVTASQTAMLIGMNRNTVNQYFNIFRQKIYRYQIEAFEEFVGKVEVDESYFGASRMRGYHGKLKRGRGTQKQPVFGIFLRQGKVYTEVVPNCSKKVLQGIIRGRVDASSAVYTDSWRGYDGLVDVGFDKHFRVNHGKNEFALEGEVNINGIESFWSFTKRRLKKFNGVKVNFLLHLKECEWRWKRDTKLLYTHLKVIYYSTRY